MPPVELPPHCRSSSGCFIHWSLCSLPPARSHFVKTHPIACSPPPVAPAPLHPSFPSARLCPCAAPHTHFPPSPFFCASTVPRRPSFTIVFVAIPFSQASSVTLSSSDLPCQRRCTRCARCAGCVLRVWAAKRGLPSSRSPLCNALALQPGRAGSYRTGTTPARRAGGGGGRATEMRRLEPTGKHSCGSPLLPHAPGVLS